MTKAETRTPVQNNEPRTPVQKIEISKRARNLLIAGGISLGIVAGVAAMALFPAARDTLACEVETEVLFSPGGKFRVQKAEKACRWGLGQAAERVEVKIDKQAKGGWFMLLPLEYDALDHNADPSPAIKWKGPNSLEVTVYSNELSGALVRRIDDLTVTSRYLKSPRK